MTNLPKIKSYEQLLGEMSRSYTSKIGVDDQNIGSANLCFFETIAQSVYRSTSSVLNTLRDQSIDSATGEALRKLAADERVTINGAKVGTGFVSVTDSNFKKIQTKIYAGGKPVMIGAIEIFVSDASSFPSAGSLYIGRGTNNFEGPISYTSITQVGGYYSVNLSTPTTKYHNISESVILGQGGIRIIQAGTVVRASSSGIDINFTVTSTSSILDGEDTVERVPVVSQEPRTGSNVPADSIKTFASEPFSGAVVINTEPIDNATDEDSDEVIRVNIKRAIATRGKGTDLAIKSACLGASSTDDSSTVTSDEIVRGDKTVLFVDNGNGYEEKQQGVGIEYLVDSAIGGEQNFQLGSGGKQTSIAKAYIETSNKAPFSVKSLDKLSVLVGDTLSEHTFNLGDFSVEGSATAYEICSSLNANTDLLFYATTSQGGTKVTLRAKSESYDYIQVSSPDAGINSNLSLNFPTGQVRTLNLYKNKKLLNKDGKKAFVYSEFQSLWSSLISSGETLIVKVDNTQFITYTITDSDFIEEGNYTSLSSTNSVESWVNVFNSKLIGVTASYSGTSIFLSSNLGYSKRAKIEIDQSSTLVLKGMFSLNNGLISSGESSDYVLSRNTAQIDLFSPLRPKESLTVGTEYSRALINSSIISGGAVTLTDSASIWICVDERTAQIIPHGLSSGSLVNVTQNAGKVRFATSSTAFSNVQIGDRMILWSREFNVNNRGEWVVFDVSSSYVEVKPTATEYANIVLEAVTFTAGLSFVRAQKIQKITLPAGSYTTVTLSEGITSKIIGAKAFSQDDEIVVLETLNRDPYTGSLIIVAQNDIGQNLGFTVGSSSLTESGHLAYRSSIESNEYPLFIQSTVSADNYADPTYSFLSSVTTVDDLSLNKNAIINMARSISEPVDTMSGSVQIADTLGSNLSIRPSNLIRRVKVGDRIFLTSPLNFSQHDSIVAIMDDDTSGNTFTLPLYRKVKTNPTKPEDAVGFRCFDVDAGPTARLVENFSSLSFNDYKALMKSRCVLDDNSVSQDALAFRTAIYGKGGESYKIGYKYPSSPDLGISHSVEISDIIKIIIYLKSGANYPSGHNGTTIWDVAVAPNVPSVGFERVTFTYLSGQPVDMGGLNIGDYVTIGSKTGFNVSNQGTFKVSGHVNTSFSIDRKIGSAVIETLIPTLVTYALSFYRYSATTAEEINVYVNSNMTNHVSSSILNDGGTTGSGEVIYSTEEFSDWVYDSVSFVDGENYILSTDLSAVAPNSELVFKNPLTLHSLMPLYNFTDGEEFYLVPTTYKQVTDLVNILAVSGVSTVGQVECVNGNSQIAISSQTFGSGGAVQIIDGSANSLITAIRGTSTSLINGKMISKVDSADAAFLVSGMVGKIEAQNYQKKPIGISSSTNLQITATDPSYGYSKITLSNRQPSERYFGSAYNFVRTEGSEFLVEKQGKLTCFSYTGIGQNPSFSKTLDLSNSGLTANLTVDASGLSTLSVSQGFFAECSIGDILTLGSPFDASNQGYFKITAISDNYDFVSYENSTAVEELLIDLTVSDISCFANIKEGDFVTIGQPFDVLNRGKFKIIKIVGNSFYIENSRSVDEKTIAASTSIPWDITLGSTKFTIQNNGQMEVINGDVGFTPNFRALKVGDIYNFGSEFNINNQGDFVVVAVSSTNVLFNSTKTFNESGIVVTTNANARRPAMVFFPENSAIAGDKVVFTSNVAGTNNNGSFVISEVLSKNEVVVSGVMASVSNFSLLVQNSYLYLEDADLFTCYKKILTTAIDPGNANLTNVVFETDNGYSKINESSGCLMSIQSKLGFDSSIQKGADSYSYNTGLIGECNRIIYGDPRDNITYPGVGAAGAEIFVRAPLIKRIQVAISIRAKTGIPFVYLTEKVRSTVYSVINSSPIGTSIAISSIISAVNSVQGVQAVSISSPQYDVTHDMIAVSASEKPKILNIVNDITISKAS